MQRFTYARTGAALRSQITMLTAMLSADVVVFLVIGLLVPGWWKAVVGGGGALMLGLSVALLTRPLRTAHRLESRELRLQFGRFAHRIDQEEILGADRHTEPLPRGVELPSRPFGYHPDSETLYLLADKRNLVEVRLARPGFVQSRKLGKVSFSRLVLSLDEPDAFVAALREGVGAGVATPATGPAPNPATASIAPAASAAASDAASGAASDAASGAASHAAAALPGAILQLDGLRRRYGDFTAVDGISLQVRPGEVLAFLGANGAGKTTTIRMMTGLLRPTGGRVLVGGQDLWAGGPEVRRQIGYVPDVPLLYEGLTAREFLWLVAGLYGLTPAQGRTRADELLALLGLERWSDQLIRHFSLGMKRKMAIAAALVHRPRVLLLDEVTNGLDPRASREVKDLIAGAAREGAAVFLTTHLLDVAQELAARVAIIDRGQLRALGTVAELRHQTGRPGAGLEELFLALTGTGVSA